MEECILTDDDFYKKYHPERNKVLLALHPHDDPDSIGAYNGYMYETYGDEYKRVEEMLKENPNRIWTIIDNNSGWTGICAGWHYVDRMGYMITEEPWTDSDETYTVWDETEVNDLFDKLTAPELREIFPGKDISDFDDPDDWFQTPEYDALLEDWHELDFDRKEEILANWKKKNDENKEKDSDNN